MTTKQGSSATAGVAEKPDEKHAEKHVDEKLDGTETPDRSAYDQADPADELARLRAENAKLKRDEPAAAADAELVRLRAENAKLRAANAPDPAADVEPAPLTHVLGLACGDTALSPNPHPSHHSCDVHGTVPVTGVWDRPVDAPASKAT